MGDVSTDIDWLAIEDKDDAFETELRQETGRTVIPAGQQGTQPIVIPDTHNSFELTLERPTTGEPNIGGPTNVTGFIGAELSLDGGNNWLSAGRAGFVGGTHNNIPRIELRNMRRSPLPDGTGRLMRVVTNITQPWIGNIVLSTSKMVEPIPNIAPQWLLDAPESQWLSLSAGSASFSGNTLDAVKPITVPEGATGHASIVVAWGGAAPGERCLLLSGGGHGDYGGNELYCWDAFYASWRRINNPSIVAGGDATTYGDGRPRPPHTYGCLVHTPGQLWQCSQAGPYPSGDSFGTVFRYDLSDQQWTNVGNYPGGASGGLESYAVYSPLRGLIYFTTTFGHVFSINVATGARSLVYQDNFASGANFGCTLTLWDSIGALIYRASNGAVSVINVDNFAAGWTQLTVSGTLGISVSPGFVWHEPSKKVICWGHSTGRENLFRLAPPTTTPAVFADILGTWTATSFSPAGGAVVPSNPQANGTFGRFNIIRDIGGIDIVVIVNSTTGPVYVMRLPSGGI